MASTTLVKSLLLLSSLFLSTPPSSSSSSTTRVSLSIDILSPNILTSLLQPLQTALSDGLKLSSLFSIANSTNLLETQKGSIQDCTELHQITLSSLQKCMSIVTAGDPSKLADARALLSAAMTNKVTCLEGLDSATGLLKSPLINALTGFYTHVSNSLSMLPKPDSPTCGGDKGRRRLLGFPRWLSGNARRVLLSSGEWSEALKVAQDGSGNFTTISDAINFAPNNSIDRVVVRIKKGVYEENVEIPSWKTNIVLVGDGSDATVISGKRSAGDGWSTFRSATVAVSGEGFLARDIKFENTAGPEKFQAVALRINADKASVYRCTMTGYQDTLYVHSFRQFYRECNIYGTIDYIFGNAAVVFQACNIVSRMPMKGQFNVITAQSRDSPDEETGISIQNCKILAMDDLSTTVRSYLGRPWKNYSTTVYMGSYIGGFIEPEGWSVWDGDQGLSTLYYGEYENYGPGSDTGHRVSWPGYHVMNRDEACNFTVSALIDGQQWLDSTSVPYDDGV